MTDRRTRANRNKSITKKFFNDVFNKGKLAFVDKSVAANYTFDGKPQTGDQVKGFATALRTTMPDLHFVLEAILAEGDKVALRWRLTGRHTGGPNPTGHNVTATGTNILTFNAKGLATSNWQNGACTVIVTGQPQTVTDHLIYQN